jgi:hypothetical protein
MSWVPASGCYLKCDLKGLGLMENKRQEGKPTRDKILEAISTYTKSNGYPPSIRELAEMTGLKSTATVYGHLQRLECRGKIARGVDRSRSIRVLEDSNQENRTIMSKDKIEIIETLGMLSDQLDDCLREFNMVRYNGREIRFHIRSFAADYKCEDQGVTLTIGEIKRLKDLLNSRDFG